jgi:hypothetical protein
MAHQTQIEQKQIAKVEIGFDNRGLSEYEKDTRILVHIQLLNSDYWNTFEFDGIPDTADNIYKEIIGELAKRLYPIIEGRIK